MVRRDTLLVLNLRLNVVDGIRRFDFEGDRLAGQGLDKDLHTATQTKDEVKGGFLLDVVVGKSTAVLKLLASKDQTLLVGRNAFLVLDLRLNIVDGVGGLNLEGNGLASEGLDDCFE